MAIRYPVFVRETDSGDITNYSSLSAMQDSLEEVDVQNGIYEAWDAAAAPLTLSIQKYSGLSINEVPHGVRPAELSAALIDYARRSGIDVDQTLLESGQFAAALEEIEAALKKRQQSIGWWKWLSGRKSQ